MVDLFDVKKNFTESMFFRISSSKAIETVRLYLLKKKFFMVEKKEVEKELIIVL